MINYSLSLEFDGTDERLSDVQRQQMEVWSSNLPPHIHTINEYNIDL